MKQLWAGIAAVVFATSCGGAASNTQTPTSTTVTEASCPEVKAPSTTRPPSPPAPEDVEPAFRPATYREGDRTVMPVTFPDGTTAELVYEPKLAIEDALVVPGWTAGTTPAGVDRDLVIRYGSVGDLAGLITRLVSTELVRSDATVCVYEFRRVQEYLVFEFEHWIVGVHSADQMSSGMRMTWARGLTLHVGADGFPVLGSTGGIYFWNGAPGLSPYGPALGFSKGGPGIDLRLNVCTPDQGLYESGGLAGYGRRCVPGTSAQISTNNYAGATVDEVLQGLDVRAVRRPDAN